MDIHMATLTSNHVLGKFSFTACIILTTFSILVDGSHSQHKEDNIDLLEEVKPECNTVEMLCNAH